MKEDFNKIFFAIQAVLIFSLFWLIPNSIIIQLILILDLLFVVYLAEFVSESDKEIAALRRDVEQNSIEIELIDSNFNDKVNELVDKFEKKKTTRKTTKKETKKAASKK